jgi:hypothetical protein
MISPIQTGKTYGVLHTESFFSFLGFAKKVGSDETQKVDVFLNDKLIDTIEANEFIQKIDDMYDVESKAFTYNLPVQYIIGTKAIISFKNHDSGEELLNSPYTLIDKNHEKFNEAKFLHSLNEPISEELKDMYKPNSIGFLATKENLEDEEFMGYIEYISDNFRNNEINCFYYSENPSSNKVLKNIKNMKYISVSSIKDVLQNIEIYIQNLNIQNNKLREILLTNFDNIFCIVYNKDVFELTLKEHSNMSMKKGFPYFDNPTYFGFTDKEITKSNGNMHSLINFNFFGIDFDIDINQSIKDYLNFNIYNVINNKEYKRYRNNLFLKFKQYYKEKNEY